MPGLGAYQAAGNRVSVNFTAMMRAPARSVLLLLITAVCWSGVPGVSALPVAHALDEAERLHREDGFPRERDEGRPLHRLPLVGDGDRHDLALEVGGLAAHDGEQFGA